MSGIAFDVSTLCQHTNVNWSQSIAEVDLLNMYGRRQDVETTFQAMGLDHRKLPQRCDPSYRHTASDDKEVIQLAHAEHMRALMAGQAPPNIGSQASSSQAPPQSSSAFSQRSQASGTSAAPATPATQLLRNEDGTVFQLPPTPPQCEYMIAIPISRQAARDAFVAMEHNANGYSMGEWYVWYLSLEIGESLFAQKFTWVKPPKDDLVISMREVPDDFTFGPRNGIVRALTADMVKNPRYQGFPNPPAQIANERFSEFNFWLTPGSTDIPQNAVRNPKDGIVAGFTSATPGRLWKFMTGHLQKLQSPISKSYFEQIEYVKVPAFWSGILNPYQLQHALKSVSEKWINTTSLPSSTGSLMHPFSALQSLFQMAQAVPSQSSVT